MVKPVLKTRVQPQFDGQDLPYLVPVKSVRPVLESSTTTKQVRQVLRGVVAVALAFVCFQGFRCSVVSALKLHQLYQQHNQVAQIYHEAAIQHHQLKDKISLYSSPEGVEQLARDGLELVRPDEILVRLYPR